MGSKKHVTSACLNCRRRKVKCDGTKTCSNCSTAQLDCVYNAEADMRKISAKRVILDLRARVAELEGVLRDNSTERLQASSPDTSEATTADSRIMPTTYSQEMAPAPPPESHSSPDIKGSRGPVPPEHSTHSISTGSPMPRSPSQHNVTNTFAESSTAMEGELVDFGILQLGHCNSSTFMYLSATDSPPIQTFEDMIPDLESLADTTDTEGDITDILAARVRALRIAEDGQLRYYGPTSNLHVHPNGFQSLSRSTIRHVETEGQGVLRRLGLDREVSGQVQMHLAKLYFAWEDPIIHVVDEDVFFEEKNNTILHGKSSPYYSETLNNAICAIGANLAGNQDLDLPEPASEFFSARAKALLDIEMDSPTVATVQALVVMSASEAAFTRDARGWLYSGVYYLVDQYSVPPESDGAPADLSPTGMAARLSADLGLHLDVSKHKLTGLLTDRDLKIRAIAFWGVFVHEHMWSMYVGRPWGMGIRNITTPRPWEYAETGKTWRPYPRAVGQSDIPEPGLPFPLEQCTDANIYLCEIMRTINATLYSGRRLDANALAEFLFQTKQGLKSWHDGLDPALRLETSGQTYTVVPAVLQLHMQFHATMIALYRPYMSSSLVHNGDDEPTLRDQVALSDAIAGCVAAAHQVAEILRRYQNEHSLRRTNIQIVHIRFTASLVFIHDFCTMTDYSSRVSLNDLQLCCHALGEIGHAYGNATRALEVVILVKSEWQRLATSMEMRGGLKRRSASMTIPYSLSLKHDDAVDRTKRRSRGSVSASTTSYDRSSYLKPPSFSAFQMLCDSFTGQSIDMTMPAIGEGLPPAWPISSVSTFPFGDLMDPMGWSHTHEQTAFLPDRNENGASSAILQDTEVSFETSSINHNTTAEKVMLYCKSQGKSSKGRS
ncbi:hypothetical protein BN1708_013565 [Verticillium longisporum]|uniref:Zn(2)-C6 fungal-type domain-containing protein n=1 Tax=Verticillium longisporum TaxID=100787 RepID=A0A0G4LMP7_VERLO|nr:hypothetical protein BN1708_013565 [Verticillium longisporum]